MLTCGLCVTAQFGSSSTGLFVALPTIVSEGSLQSVSEDKSRSVSALLRSRRRCPVAFALGGVDKPGCLSKRLRCPS